MATRMSTPRRSAVTWGRLPTPPKTTSQPDPAAGRVAPEALGDLRGELAGRGQHQGADRPAATVGLDAQQLVEDGEGEGCGLSGAGLGAGEHIAGFEGVGNGLSLNRSWLGVAKGLEDGDQLGVEIQGLEATREGARAGFLVHCRNRQMGFL